MLVGYIDESGTHLNSEFFVLGGVVLDREQVKFAERDWKSVLDRFGLPFFHMAKFVSSRKPFKGWTDVQKRELIEKLYNIMPRRIRWVVQIGLDLKAYGNLPFEQFKDEFVSPYALCARTLFMGNADHLNDLAETHDEDRRVSYVFESGCQQFQDFRGAWNLIEGSCEQKKKYRLAEISTADKRTAPVLQLADIVAYEGYKHLKGRMHSGWPERLTMQRLLADCKVIGKGFDQAALRQLIAIQAAKQ